MLSTSKQPLRNGSTSVQGVRKERKSVSLNGQLHPRAGSYKPASAGKSNLTLLDSKRQLSVNNGIGPGRPGGAKAFPSKMPVENMDKKTPAPAARNPLTNGQKAPSSKMHLCNSKQGLEQKKASQEHTNSKIPSKKPVSPSMSKQAAPSSMLKRPALSSMLKRPAPSSMSKRPATSLMSNRPAQSSMSRPQLNKPLKQVSSRATSQIQPPKRKHLSEDDEALEEIRRMFNTQRYVGCDDDDSDMEANFDEIMKEERRSAKIARMEDEEQERLIAEEEERERRRRLAKKRRLSH